MNNTAIRLLSDMVIVTGLTRIGVLSFVLYQTVLTD